MRGRFGGLAEGGSTWARSCRNTQKALTESSDAFLAYLANWYAGLEPLDVKVDWAANGIAANNVAVLVIDMVNGFCSCGARWRGSG